MNTAPLFDLLTPYMPPADAIWAVLNEAWAQGAMITGQEAKAISLDVRLQLLHRKHHGEPGPAVAMAA